MRLRSVSIRLAVFTFKSRPCRDCQFVPRWRARAWRYDQQMADMMIEVWSDVVCSWCYIGKRHLERALEAFPQRDQVALRWRSFELDPGIAADAGTADEELARRRGISLEEARVMHEQTE